MYRVDREYLTRTLRDLVRINSINPMLDPRGPGEAEIAAYTARTLRDLGLEVALHEPAPGRVSVVGRLPGRGDGRALMLNAHYDTVGVDGMPNPFSGEVRDGRLYGRGAYDMKGSLAACIAAAHALTKANIELSGDLLVAAVADEEHASIGTQDLIGRYRVDGAIVTEPTALGVCLAHKGFVWVEYETFGRAAHGSKPELGVDANMRMGRVLNELEVLEKSLRLRSRHPLIGTPSLHAATLQGGTGLSTYAAYCRLQVERRTLPGETESQVLGEFRDVVARLRAEDSAFDAKLTHVLTREPFEARRDGPVVQTLAASVRRTLGREPEMMGETPWMDSALLAAAGIDTVVIGPDGAGAHSAEEWVDLDTVEQLAAILADTAVRYCGSAAKRPVHV